MNNISLISFNNYFRPPIDSYSGRLFSRIELGPVYPEDSRIWGAFNGRRFLEPFQIALLNRYRNHIELCDRSYARLFFNET